MGDLYETDVVAWAEEQAALLRSGQLSAIDASNIAEEIEDVGKNEQRALASRLAVLVAHLLKWQFQPDLRSKSWQSTIREQRSAIARKLRASPSLHHTLADEEWLKAVWQHAVADAATETGLDFPDYAIWPTSRVLDPNFFPD